MNATALLTFLQKKGATGEQKQEQKQPAQPKQPDEETKKGDVRMIPTLVVFNESHKEPTQLYLTDNSNVILYPKNTTAALAASVGANRSSSSKARITASYTSTKTGFCTLSPMVNGECVWM